MKASDLDAVKLVDPDNMASEIATLEAVERAVEQGCSSWGCTPRDAVTLRLTHELRQALLDLDGLQEVHNKLKGEQLAHGRTKKKLEEALAALADVAELRELIDNAEDA